MKILIIYNHIESETDFLIVEGDYSTFQNVTDWHWHWMSGYGKI